MAWNRPGSECKDHNAICNRKRNFVFLGLVAAAVIAFVAVGLYFASNCSSSPSDAEPTVKQSRIKEVKPVFIQKTVPAEIDKKERKKRNYDPTATNKWGLPKHWGPNMRLRPACTTVVDKAAYPLEMKIFRHGAEIEIARLLLTEPGTEMLDCVEYNESFVKSFKKSLIDPALVTKDDSEEAKALKRAVNETKADLKARMDAGEDIAKIMQDTRRELIQLGTYRKELLKLIDEKERDRKASRADLEDIVAAANQMLDERGLKPVTLPEFYYQQIELRNERHKAKQRLQNNDQ